MNLPRIANGSLVGKSRSPEQWYILLTNDYFVETSLVWIQQCKRFPEACFTDSVPMKIVSGILNPAISQYFNILDKHQMEIRIEKRFFIMNIGKSFLAYATIEPIEIRVDCKRRKSETINLTGKGLSQIIDGCKVSSPLFSIILPKEIGII